MDKYLEDLRQKQRKLTFLLGEKVENLYKSGLLRFLYTSDSVKEEEEVLRLLRFIGYLEERITKLTQINSKDDELAYQGVSQNTEESEEAGSR